MKYSLLFLLIICSCFSCQDKRKEDVKALYREWSTKEIVFPSHLQFVVQDRDTAFSPFDKPYKIVTHVDSSDCFSCRLNFTSWWKMTQMADSVGGGNVQFLYFLSSKREDVARKVQMYNFTYPVCVDPQDSLGILNQFPEDENFHTFLLDKDNRVLAIGNPIYSTRIRDLYLNIIQGKATPPVASEEKEPNYTEISVPETEVDFGACDWQKEHTAVFKIRNTGQKLLVVHEVKTSCGCLEADYTKAPVKPGGEAEVRLTFKATQPGYFRKVALVRCNTEGQLLRLYVTGEAE